MNYEIVREALRQGHTVTLLATEIAPDLEQHESVTWIRMPVTRLPTTLVQNQVFSLYSTRWLKRNRAKFDILHVNGSITGVAGDVNASHFVHSAWMKSPARTAGKRRVAYDFYQTVYTRWNGYCERGAYRKARRVVAVSEQVRRELLQIGVLPSRVGVIINGVDLEEFHPGEASREALGLPVSVPLALFVGDIRTPRKNLDTVLKSLVHVPGLHLAVLGKTDGSPYPQMATELGVADRVSFLGFRRDVAQIMRASDMFVFPSRYEACSLVLLEALASGLPVVTAATAGGAEVITPKCGFVLSDPNDVATLTQTLCCLSSNIARCREMGVSARAVAEQYGWAAMANAYLNTYEELLT